MNDVQNIFDRQLGNLGTNGRLNYDNALKRLTVNTRSLFYGLQSADSGASFDPDPPIFACRFAEATGFRHILALANEDGRVAIQDTKNIRSSNAIESFQCHNNAVFDLAWMPGYMTFVTVSGDHTACMWDLGESAPCRMLTLKGHTRSVKSAVFSPEAPAVVATGGRDGAVLVWDVRAGAAPAAALRPDNRLAQCHAPAAAAAAPLGKRSRREPRALSITGLAFQDGHSLLSCAECDGNIKVWDLRKNYSAYRREPLPRRAIPYCGTSTRLGYSHLALDPPRTRLFASCMDGVIYCFNLMGESAAPEQRYAGHESGSFYIKAALSDDGRYLVSGSSDKRAYVWNVRRSEPLVRLAAHRAEVTCAAWRACGEPALVTCSDDARHMIWRVGRELPAPGEVGRELPAPGEVGRELPDPGEVGRAEPAPRAPPPPPWGALDRTPTAIKRPPAPAPAPASADRGGKRPRPDPPERRGKRCLAALLNATKDTDDAESIVKRMKLEPTGEERALPAGTKRAREPSPCGSGEGLPARSIATPTARYEPSPDRRRSLRDLSPSRKRSPSPEPVKIITFGTPTKDLPNFILNGDAPHLRLMSPAKKKPETTDWLTQLVRERRVRTPEVESPSSPAPLASKENVPARRNSTTDKTPKSSKNSTTLFKYFTVANKEK